MSVIYNSGPYFIVEIAPQGAEGYSRHSNKTAKGNIFGVKGLARNAPISLEGKWVRTKKYGRQFQIKSWKPYATTEVEAINFLTTSIEGFDYFTADHLVKVYGADPYEALSDHNQVLSDVSEANEKDLKTSLAGWGRAIAVRDLANVLKSEGLTASDIEAAVRRFGSDAPKLINENPFRLMEIPGFSFDKVDKLASSLGLKRSNPQRLEGAVLWSLNEAARNGHLFLKRGEVPRYALDLRPPMGPLPTTDKPGRGYREAIQALADRKAVIVEPDVGVYLSDYYYYERVSAEILTKLQAPATLKVEYEPFLDEFEKSSQITLSNAQREAVRKLISNRVMTLTGLPGTGKTMSVKALVRLFEVARLSFVLMAPTGIASKRLSHVTGHPASTIHRALGYDGVSWSNGPDNKYVVDAVIVDEVSMVDMELLFRLLTALRSDTLVVLVGDEAQLHSVGPGNVLKELVACKGIPSVRLTKIFRQAAGSAIVGNSHLINNGKYPILGEPKGDSEFKYVRVTDEAKILKIIVRMAAKLKSRDANFQVVSPKYDGDVGVNSLNSALREVLNPPGPPEWKGKFQHFRVGDRVMVVKNDYKKGVYNGDVGKLIYILNGSLMVRIYGVTGDTDMEVSFTEAEADDKLRLAYAITVHKCVHPDTLVETSQGLLRAADLPDSGEVQTPWGLRAYRGKVTNPVSPLITLETRDRYVLRVTPTHGVDVWNPRLGGYVRREAQDVTPGDFVRLGLGLKTGNSPTPLPPDPGADTRASAYTVPVDLTEELAEFMGLMVADGTLYSKGFRLLKRHLEVVDRFAELGSLLFGLAPSRGFKTGGYYAEFNSVPVARWLSQIGGLNPWSKAVPPCILSSGKVLRSRFLRGLFEDGSVHLRSDGSLDHIELGSYDPHLLETVRILLLGLGIPTSAWRPSARKGRLFIYGAYCKTFQEEIGFISRFKTQRLDSLVGLQTKYLVPISRGELTHLATLLGGRKFMTSSEKNAFLRGYMSRHQLQKTLGRLPSESGDHFIVEALEQRLGSHHTKVAKVSWEEGPSVCVEVPEGHQFIQGGFYGWNSQGSEFDTIIMPVVGSQGRMLQRNLLYTAITRAKKQVWLLGEESAIRRAVDNNKVVFRNTQLSEAVTGVLNESNEQDPGQTEE